MRKIAFIFLVLLLSLSGALAEESVGVDAGFSRMAETETRALLLNAESFQVRLVNKQTEERFDAVVLNGTQGNKTIKNTQKSILTVNYISNAQNGATNTMDSYSKAVQMQAVSCTPIENGFELGFSLGDNTLIIDDLPKAIRADKYQRLLEGGGWNSKEKKTFSSNYRAVRLAGFENEYMIRVKDDSLSALMIKQLYQLIFSSGLYTAADMEEDNAAVGYERSYLPRLHVPVRFQLAGDDLLVTVPAGEIIFTEENEIVSFDLLPYFLRADQTQTGYIFIPDGSGALIRLNNQKLSATAYQGRVYGQDPLTNASAYAAPLYPIALPVYGLKAGDSALLAILEEGAELASIQADISGKSDEFNRIFSRFTLREIENVALSGNESIFSPRFNEDVYQGNITVRYRLLSGDQANYTGMARAYRAYLLERGALRETAPEADAPFYMELLGAVAKKKFFLGVPYLSSVQATTPAQAAEIYQAYHDRGVKNIRLIYSGLFYGGVQHAALTQADLDGGISGAELQALSAALAQNGDGLYPGVYMGRVYGTRGFSKVSQAPRRHDGEAAEAVNDSVASQAVLKKAYSEQKAYYVSPVYLPQYTQKALASLARYPAEGLSVFDLGNTLVGDNKRGENISRISALSYYEQAFEQLTEKYSLLLARPALYALPYAAGAVNLPSRDNGFQITDASIPFLQMVLEGCVSCSGEAWNLSAGADLRSQLLFALESKSSPRFTFTFQSPSLFHNAVYEASLNYFSTQYQQWLDFVPAYYQEYNAFYQLVRDARLQSHELLSDDLRRVTYDNGVTLILNYGAASQALDGRVIPALGYVIDAEEELP